MQGTIYYQTSQLVKIIFKAEAKKFERIDTNHENFKKIASYETMKTYRRVWNNLFKYLRIHWKVKDCVLIEVHHIEAYLVYKIDGRFPSEKYIEKNCSAAGKLEDALNLLQEQNYNPRSRYEKRKYDFSIRHTILKNSKKAKLLTDNYHNRAYKNPYQLIEYFDNPKHRLAAKIELQGGARVEGCEYIKEKQLLGYEIDPITNQLKGKLITKEKGGKIGEIYIDVETYEELENHIQEFKIFKIDRQQYYKEIRKACATLKIRAEGTHGFRWNFAERRVLEYTENGHYYEQALQAVSYEMKHKRAYITKHYLGGK